MRSLFHVVCVLGQLINKILIVIILYFKVSVNFFLIFYIRLFTYFKPDYP